VYVAGGSFTLTNGMLANNEALGGTAVLNVAGGGGDGGGLLVAGGTAVLNNDTLSGNLAQGGNGATGSDGGVSRDRFGRYHIFPAGPGSPGGSSGGGGLVASGGTVTLTNVTFSNNRAQGGTGGNGGNGGLFQKYFAVAAGNGGSGGTATGGGLWVIGGSVQMVADTVTGNAALGGAGGNGGRGIPNGADGSPGQSQGGGIANANPVVAALIYSLSSTTTTVTVNNASSIVAGAIIEIDNELMSVTAVDAATNTLTVVRGVDGTTASAHGAGTSVFFPLLLDAFTLANVLNNIATNGATIYGPYLDH
jgi:hypothetical protein